MNLLKSLFSSIVTFSIIILILFASFLWWNNHPPLPYSSNPAIIKIKLNNKKNQLLKNYIRVASYNIHFGIGYDIKTSEIDKSSYIKRLDDIANILSSIDSDVVLLQEVDFSSARSHFINEAKYLAKKSGYEFVAISPTLRKRIHLNYHSVIGKIDFGIAILSKHPIVYNENIVFNYSSQIPFFMNWLYDPHGAQKCTLDLNGEMLDIINVHLEPWCTFTRQNQMNKIKNIWLETSSNPLIIGGDFNSIVANGLKKIPYHLKDAPWFMDLDSLDYKNDRTINILKNMKYSEAFPKKLYIKKKTKYYTFPSKNPKVKIDYIFAGNKARIITGDVFVEAKDASDHLPIIAEIKINKKISSVKK